MIMINPKKIQPPQVMLFLYVVATILHGVFKPSRMVPTAFVPLGLLIFAAGLSFMLWSRQQFIKQSTPVRHSEQPTTLVRQGPFKWSRNPMYIGGLVMFTGIGIMAGTWPFLAVPVVMFFILERIFIPWEERYMTGLFKNLYEDYLRKTRRWF